MKGIAESKTVWTSAGLLISSLVTIALHFTGASVVGAELLGGAFTGAISGLVFLVLRLVTREPIGSNDEGNGADAANALIVLVVALCLSGCTTIRAKQSVALKVQQGPPCVVVVMVDGKKAVEVKGPKACRLTDAR